MLLILMTECPVLTMWTSSLVTCLRGFANNKGADQPAHTRSLISAFVIRFLESTIYDLATSEFSIFQLVSIAEETGLKLALSDTPKTGFSRDEAHMLHVLSRRPLNEP